MAKIDKAVPKLVPIEEYGKHLAKMLPQQASEWVRRWGDHSEQICSKKGCKYYGTTFGTKNGKPVVACSEHQTELDICNHCGNQIPYGRCPKCDPEDQQELLQQRSEAVELDTALSVWSSLAQHPPAEKAIRTIVAQRDTTIAALRAEVEGGKAKFKRQVEDFTEICKCLDRERDKIATLQARVTNLEYGLNCIVNDNPDSEIDVRHFAKAVLNGTVTPTTEKP